MAVVFDVTSPIAMFRKGYTTTSSVSFPFPPPTAIAGLVGAVTGLDHDSASNASRAAYWKHMAGTQVALRILRPGSTAQYALNFVNTKSKKGNEHNLINHQFLRSSAFRIYVRGGLEGDLRGHLEEKTFVYTPYLGVAYALCTITYVGNFMTDDVQQGPVDIDSVLPWSEGVAVDVLSSGGCFRERVPFSMDTERSLVRTVDVVYSPSPDKKLKITRKEGAHVTRCGTDTIAWFPAW